MNNYRRTIGRTGAKTGIVIAVLVLLASGSAAATNETFLYNGNAPQTWTVPSSVTEATFYVTGPAGGGGRDSYQGDTLGGAGGSVKCTVDVSGYSSLDLYVAEHGSNSDYTAHDYPGDGSGGWGYVDGSDADDPQYAGGGGGLSAVVTPGGTTLCKAGGGGGGSASISHTGGAGADGDVGGAGGSAGDGGDGDGWAVASATDVTTTVGGGATFQSDVADDSRTDHGEITVEYTESGIIIHNPPSVTADATPDLAVTANESIDTWRYNVDGGSNSTFTPNITLSELADGEHTVNVYATNTTGHTKSRSKTFTVETTPSVSTQSDWNRGTFDGTSADRRDNSGILGLGYLNGSQAGQSQSHALNGGALKGHWRMDAANDPLAGSHDVKDYSGAGNNGTTVNFDGGERGQQGVFGTNAFDFDGNDDYVETTSDLDGFSKITVSAWIRPDSLSNTDSRIVADDNNNAYHLVVNQDNYRFRVATVDDGDPVWLSYATGGSPSTNQWTHVVATFNGTDEFLYENGEEVARENIGAVTINDNNQKTRIGSGNSGGSEQSPFDGMIDEVRIYDRALTASEIRQLYLNTSTDQYFTGNYTSSVIQNSDGHSWDALSVNVTSIPEDTAVDAVFRAVDGQGTVQDTQVITLSEGNANYSITVQDSADAEVVFNGTSTNASATWEIGGFTVHHSEGAPSITIHTPTTGTTADAAPDLAVTVDAAVGTWRYNVDGGSNSTFTPNTTLSSLADGQHTVNVYASDSEGNTGFNSQTFTVDTTAPSINIHTPGSGDTNDPTPWLNVTTDESTDTWVYSVDGGSNSTFTPNTTLSSLADGGHTVAVYANDSVGNTRRASRTFTVDTNTPGVTIHHPPAGTTRDPTPWLNVTADEDIFTWLYNLGGGNTSFTPNTTLSTLEDGQYMVNVYANDDAGNTGFMSRLFTVDRPWHLLVGQTQSTFRKAHDASGDGGWTKWN